jgi:FAD/FMN-containing dehydrogenase
MSNKQILNELISIVGSESVSDKPYDLLSYATDSYSAMMGLEAKLPDFVVLPISTNQVQQIVKLAAREHLHVYPRGQGANIAGSALPWKGGLVLDLKRMDKILEVSQETMTATIQPGVNWAQLRKEAQKFGLDTMPILGPYHVTPVGNFLHTNITAYSTRHMSDRAVALEAVLPDGEILKTGSMALDGGKQQNPYFRQAYGPDVTGLFRGSLGNFGVVTTLVLRLRPKHQKEQIAFTGFDCFDDVLAGTRSIERLEFTRCSFFANRAFWARVLSSPEDLLRSGPLNDTTGKLPNWLLASGLGGSERMVSFYNDILFEEVAENSGRRWAPGGELEAQATELSEGASQIILRMYAPWAGYIPLIGCLPPSKAQKALEIGDKLIDEFGLKDPISGDRLEKEVIVTPYDRCSTIYLEQEFLFDPRSPEALENARNCLRAGYSRLASECGAVHTIPNKSLLKRLNPGYSRLLRTLKLGVDPLGLFVAGPYSYF